MHSILASFCMISDHGIIALVRVNVLYNQELVLSQLILSSFKSLSKLPTSWNDVVRCNGPAITRSDTKGKALAIKIGIALPILSPISGHGFPPCLGPFNGNSMDISCAPNVCYQHQVEVGMTIDSKPYSSFLHTRYPAVDRLIRKSKKENVY